MKKTSAAAKAHGPKIEDNLDKAFRVRVAYDMPKNRDRLEAEFSAGSVSELFYGNYPWKKHASCAKVDETKASDRIILLKHFNAEISSESAITVMIRQHCRPATHLEAYAFAKAHPELQRQFRMVALGSFALNGGKPFVALLQGSSQKRSLDSYWFDDEVRGWPADIRFLVVRVGSAN